MILALSRVLFLFAALNVDFENVLLRLEECPPREAKYRLINPLTL
jgi:hypothetical protein